MSDFGDRVRIKDSDETRAAGIAGMEGDVYGVTTPSVTNAGILSVKTHRHRLLRRGVGRSI